MSKHPIAGWDKRRLHATERILRLHLRTSNKTSENTSALQDAKYQMFCINIYLGHR